MDNLPFTVVGCSDCNAPSPARDGVSYRRVSGIEPDPTPSKTPCAQYTTPDKPDDLGLPVGALKRENGTPGSGERT